MSACPTLAMLLLLTVLPFRNVCVRRDYYSKSLKYLAVLPLQNTNVDILFIFVKAEK